MDYEIFRGLQQAYQSDQYARAVGNAQTQIVIYEKLMAFIQQRAANFDEDLRSIQEVFERASASVRDALGSMKSEDLDRALPVLNEESVHEMIMWAESLPMTRE